VVEGRALRAPRNHPPQTAGIEDVDPGWLDPDGVLLHGPHGRSYLVRPEGTQALLRA